MSIFKAIGNYMDQVLMNRLSFEQNNLECELQRGRLSDSDYDVYRDCIYLEKKVR